MQHDVLERITPTIDTLSSFFERFPDHEQRYQFAIEKINQDMKVADIACGVGYGSWLMARNCQSVVGVDISDFALNHARNNFMSSNIEFIHGNSFDYEDEFDVVVSFETIEHMDELAGDEFITKIHKSLKANGVLIMSTPINKTSNKVNVSEFHLREYDDYEFPNKLKKNGFKIILMYGQGSAFHEKLYGTSGKNGLFGLIKLGIHRILPATLRNKLKQILLGDPNEGLKIKQDNWRSSMVQIAVCSKCDDAL